MNPYSPNEGPNRGIPWLTMTPAILYYTILPLGDNNKFSFKSSIKCLHYFFMSMNRPYTFVIYKPTCSSLITLKHWEDSNNRLIQSVNQTTRLLKFITMINYKLRSFYYFLFVFNIIFVMNAMLMNALSCAALGLRIAQGIIERSITVENQFCRHLFTGTGNRTSSKITCGCTD